LLIQKKHPVCEYFKKDTLIWPDLVKASNLPNNNPCPFPKGNYTIKNFVVDDSKFKALPIGKYVAKGKLIEDGKTLTLVDIVAWVKLG
jgi:ganglioside GM2 activator